jgi:VWFA-related protein
MYRVSVLFAVIFLAALSLSAQSPPAAPKPTPADDEIIKVTTDLVTTPVSVLDRSGRFVPGLKQKDFKIFENGVEQKISYFQSSEMPFTVILLIDISPSTRYKMEEIHYAAVTFVNQLRAQDKVMVVAFDSRIRVLTDEPTSEKQKIFSAIYKAGFGSGTSLYEAVSFVTDLDMIKVPGRKAVVLFTDGVDTTSPQASFESTIASTQEVDALIYPIRYNTQAGGSQQNLGGVDPKVFATLPPGVQQMIIRANNPGRGYARGQSPAEYARGKLYLEKLAENSGGRIFEAADLVNLETSFAGVAEELRRQYSIGYYPEQEGSPGERRSVRIKVPTKPNVVVRAKSGYVIRSQQGSVDSPRRPGIVAAR